MALEELRKFRQEVGLTIYDMAEKLGISASYYSLIESGKRRKGGVPYPLAEKIASILGRKPEEIFSSPVVDTEQIKGHSNSAATG